MDTIFTLGDLPDGKIKVNLDELYEKKQKCDLNTLAIYNSILNRIHTKIKHSSRQNISDQFCWYIIPEVMIGIPRYDHVDCTAYIMHELKENGFILRYTHPNLLFISWKHWIPSYVRNEIKKKTGIIVDGYGNNIVSNKNIIEDDPNKILIGVKNDEKNIKSIKNIEYKSIDTYKPSGIIYNEDLLRNIETKSRKNI